MHLIIGSGRVGLPLAHLFHRASIPALTTTRSGKVPHPLEGVAFDWNNESTFESPFSRAETFHSVFMTPPPTTHMLEVMKPFIDFAKRKGVKRFVLLSGSLITSIKEGPHGAVHEYISHLDVEWAVIRPSWFFQNFQADNLFHADGRSDTVISLDGGAKRGYVDARDIAEASFQAMTEELGRNGSYIVFGPELLTSKEVADTLASVTGRTIRHRTLTREGYKKHAMQFMPEPYAELMCAFEVRVRDGGEETLAKKGGREVWIGKRTLREYFEEIKDQWAK